MKGYGVYVWETFPGIVEVRAVGHNGKTLRKVMLPKALFSQSEVDAAWDFLRRVEPSRAPLALVPG